MLSYIYNKTYGMRGENSLAASDFSLRAMPEWYRAERETEKIIGKLSGIKELDYYIKNPDEYIRRLAILKLQKFSAKESIYVLKDVMDDNLESEANKYLAAWVLKSQALKWNFDIFVTSRYLTKISGTESYDELFGVEPGAEIPPIRFDFSASPSHSAFKLEAEDSARAGDIYFEAEFDFKQWFSTFGSRLLKSTKSALGIIFLKLPAMLGGSVITGFKKLLHSLARKGEKRVKPAAVPLESHPAEKINSTYDYYSIYREVYKKPGIIASIKKGLFNMLYLLFFPLRFALKHKFAVFCSLAALYVLFAFTDYGRAFTSKYMGIDLKDVQKNTVEKVKYYSSYALSEFNRLTGINEWKKNEGKKQEDPAIPASSADRKLYLVTAQKGLNIRKSPDSASGKVGGDPLPFGSTVVYLLKEENDSKGRTWYYVESDDGRTGWVSANFLKEKKEG